MNGLQKHSQERIEDTTEVFIECYERVWQDLYRFALYYLGNREDAEDVVQETAAEAFRNFLKLKDRSCFRAWIFKILSRKCKHSLRNVIRIRHQMELSETIPSEEDMTRALEVYDAISSLESDERMIIVLSVLQKFKCTEIAEILSKPEGTIRSKRSRALAKLREKLGGDYYE